MSNDRHVCVVYIKASAEDVWQALTEAEFTRRYFHQTDISSDWQSGSDVHYYNQDGSVAVSGIVKAVEKPRRLSFSWHVHYHEAAEREGPSQVTFELEPVEDATKLTVVHDNFPENSVVFPAISEGWIAILCNLKTLLETDEVMAVS